jgi:hypothetical protein
MSGGVGERVWRGPGGTIDWANIENWFAWGYRAARVLGFSAENADWLFGAFAITKSTGMGMGLSICRQSFQCNGGCICLFGWSCRVRRRPRPSRSSVIAPSFLS